MPYNPIRPIARGLSGAAVLIGVALAFIFGFGSFNLPVFFVALAVSVFLGSLAARTLTPNHVYGGFIGAMWMLILALYFITGWWVLFIIGGALSAILGSLFRPIMAALLGLSIFGAASMMNNQQQTPYYPPQQPYYPPQQSQQPYYQPQQTPPTYPSYQEGYQPPQGTPPSYQEGGQNHPYPPQYEQPQAQYPQQMPPQEQ